MKVSLVPREVTTLKALVLLLASEEHFRYTGAGWRTPGWPVRSVIKAAVCEMKGCSCVVFVQGR